MSVINEDRTIWELPTTSTVNLSDLVVIVNNGETKQASIEQLDIIGYQGTDLKDLSANWQSTFTSVTNTSSNWDAAYSIVQSNSGIYLLHNGNSQGQNLNIGTNDNFDLNFETAGITKVTILSTGEVGVATTNPSEKLDVNGNLKVQQNTFLGNVGSNFTEIQGTLKLPSVNQNIIEFNGETTSSGIPSFDGAVVRYEEHLFGPNKDALLFEKTDFNNLPGDGGIAFRNRDNTGTTDEAFVIRSNGNVGVGTFSPNEKLTVVGNVEINNNSDPTFLRIRENQGTDAIWELRSYHTNLGTPNNQFSIYGGLEGETLTDCLVITTSGDIGIGNSNPSTKLDVSGDISLADKICHQGNLNTCIRFPANNIFSVETNGSEKLRVLSNGNVGINTATPNEKLTVVGNISASNTPKWDSVHTTVQNTSATWVSTYNTVKDLSATWQPFMVNCTDEYTPFVNNTSIPVYSFAMPYAMKLSEVRAFVTTPPFTSGGGSPTPLRIDIKHNNTSIFSTKLHINNSANSSVTAPIIPYVILPAFSTGTGLQENAIISVFIETIGATTPGSGLKLLFK